MKGQVEVLIQLGDRYKENKSDQVQALGRISRIREGGESFGRYYYFMESSSTSGSVPAFFDPSLVISKNKYSNLYVALSKACVNPGRNLKFLDVNKILLDLFLDSGSSFTNQALKLNIQKLLELEKFKDIQSLQKDVDFNELLENINNELVSLSSLSSLSGLSGLNSQSLKKKMMQLKS